MPKIFKLCFFILAVLCWPLAASASDWVVVKTTQQVRYTVDRHSWMPVKTGLVIPNRAWVSTGPRGRLVLARGPESIAFQPNSMASVYTHGGANRQTAVYQPYGTLEFNIETRDKPHTSVQTPFLAAVVKGTRFQVHVTGKTASIDVRRGLVEVTALASGQRVHVRPGQSVQVDPANPSPLKVEGVGPKDIVKTVAPVKTRVLTQDELTGNSTSSTKQTTTTKGKAEKSKDTKPGKNDKGKPGKTDNDEDDTSKDTDKGKDRGDKTDADKGDKGKGDKGKDHDKDKDKPGKTDNDEDDTSKDTDKGKDKGKDKGDKTDADKGDKDKTDKDDDGKSKDKGKDKDSKSKSAVNQRQPDSVFKIAERLRSAERHGEAG